MHLMLILGLENVYIFLVEVIGDTWQSYIFTISFNELMNIGSDSNDPIYFFHVSNRNIALHVVYDVTPEWCQPI